MPQQKFWNVLELLNTTVQYFKEKNIENPRLNAEQLLGKVLNLKRVELYMAFERPVTKKELSTFREMVKRRSKYEPLQYILGETEFMGLPFKVSPAVLIPRPETEVLVEKVLELKNSITDEHPVIIDIGSGSGCIQISIANKWPEAFIIGTDISSAALKVAEENAILNQLTAEIISANNNSQKMIFRQGHLTFLVHDIFEKWHPLLPEHANILISNPPYITLDEMPSLAPEVKNYEPNNALTDHADGLRLYERFFELARQKEAPDCDYLFLEMSGSHPEHIIDMANKQSFSEVEVINDLNQIPRVLKIKV